MKYTLSRLVAMILIFAFSLQASYAWIGLIAESGDILNISKWNQMIGELGNKLETWNILAWTWITLTTSGNDITLSADSAVINSQTLNVPSASCVTSSLAYQGFMNAYAEIITTTPGTEIVPTGTIDPGNVSTGDANLINNNYTDLVYNNNTAGTNNKALPAVDLWSTQSVGVVRIYWWSPASYGVTNGQIQGSNNGTSWTPLVTNIVKTSGSTGDFDDYTVSGSYRYYRLFSVSGLNANWVVISELETFAIGTTTSEWVHVFHRDIEIKNDSWFVELCNNEAIALNVEVNGL